ncbi:leucine-rich repeat-containing protein 37A2 [Alligator mississippiensis]|uniref:Leucine-rich repeat-containing protein 37A2 n=1 Tax=Alligator mississippiensis TaxID=8496 RepID=A0A151PBV9_ALLMI|nr:leucine-rich repeat-containing protein 37A2 [Alligator mississippiensis]
MNKKMPGIGLLFNLAEQNRKYCPEPCLCSEGVLNCSQAAHSTKLQHLPWPRPAARNKSFFFLDFNGNSISSIEKSAWRGYPWAEYLLLRGNGVSKLQKDSFEGLLSLKHLDLSCNKILTIEKRAFEPLPFLQFLNLRGNLLAEISYGTFVTWHGMQFLQKIVLSRNPLSAIVDKAFLQLPSLKYLDLGATQVTQQILHTLLVVSLHLETLVLPDSMMCCLCKIQKDIEMSYKMIKLHCVDSCVTNSSLCATKEHLEKMQTELKEVLQSRKPNISMVLHLKSEKFLHSKSDSDILSLATFQHRTTMAVEDLISGLNDNYPRHLFKKPDKNSTELEVLPFFKLFKFDLHLKASNHLKLPKDQSNLNWANLSELKKLYLLANLLATVLREKLHEAEKDKPKKEARHVSLTTPNNHLKTKKICKDLAQKCDEKLTGYMAAKKTPEEIKECVDYMWRCINKGGDNQLRMVKREVLQIKGSKEMLAVTLNPSSTLSVLRHHKVSIPSFRKRSLSDLPTQETHLTGSFKVENESHDLTGNIIVVLKHHNKTEKVKRPPVKEYVPVFYQPSQERNKNQYLLENTLHRQSPYMSRMLKESMQRYKMKSKDDELDNLLPNKNPVFTSRTAMVLEKPPEDGRSLLDGILPNIQQTDETRWKHQKEEWKDQKEEFDFPSEIKNSSPPGNYSIQGDIFEAELNRRLSTLIPNKAVRDLISHVIRTLKMDCAEPNVQLACAKLISKTGLLMKLFSEREDLKGSSSLWSHYLWEVDSSSDEREKQKVAGKKLSEELSKDSSKYGYGNKLLLAISVTVVVMAVIAVICIIEVCSQRSAAASQSKNKSQPRWSFQKLSQGSQRKSTPEMISKAPNLANMDKPLWLRDMYLPLDAVHKKSMARKLYDEGSSGEEEIFNKAYLRKETEQSSDNESY